MLFASNVRTKAYGRRTSRWTESGIERPWAADLNPCGIPAESSSIRGEKSFDVTGASSSGVVVF